MNRSRFSTITAADCGRYISEARALIAAEIDRLQRTATVASRER